MFDISWWHLFLFAITAIILIPSKDLPKVLRTLGRYVGDARRMAGDFRRQVDDALRETELADIKDGLTKDMADIEKTASLTEEGRKLNSAFNLPATPPAAAGQMIPSVATELPVAELDAAAHGSGASVPMPVLTVPEPAEATLAAAPNGHNGIGLETRPADGIEIVRAGRGSVATRAAAAKRPASPENGT